MNMNKKLIIFTFCFIVILPQSLTITSLTSQENENPILRSPSGILTISPQATDFRRPPNLRNDNIEIISAPPKEHHKIIQSTSVSILKMQDSDDTDASLRGRQTIIQSSSTYGNNNTVLQGVSSGGMAGTIDQTVIQAAVNYGEDNIIGVKVGKNKQGKDPIAFALDQ